MKTVFMCKFCEKTFDDPEQAMAHEKTHPNVDTMEIAEAKGYDHYDGTWPRAIVVSHNKAKTLTYRLVQR